jgi:23S rRNA (adenine2030-N6)-methyltransferase
MLSYQHGYHAGGPADLHKHRVLAGLLDLLTRKPRPVTYMESHAGRGLYDLSGEQATKTGEWRAGIGATTPDGPFATALAAVRAQHGPDAYPGSPMVASALLRPTDRMILMELHPAEHAALKAAMPAAEIHRRDGREGLLALAPPKPRRGLALIAPSYERKEEYAETAAFALDLARKWPEAAILIWYPILAAARHRPMVERLRAALPTLIHEVAFPAHGGRATGMTGSGLALLNAPYGAEGIVRAASES